MTKGRQAEIRRIDYADGQGHRNDPQARGLEVAFVLRLPSGIIGSASYAFQDARDRGDDSELTNSPAHLARARLGVPLSSDLFVAGSASYDHGRLTVYGTRTDAYLVTNVTLTTRSLGDRIQGSLSVRNLFDTSYQTPGGFEHIQDAIAQDGRSFRFRLTVLF